MNEIDVRAKMKAQAQGMSASNAPDSSDDFKIVLQVLDGTIDRAEELREYTDTHTASLRRMELEPTEERAGEKGEDFTQFAPIPARILQDLKTLDRILMQIRQLVSKIQSL